MDLQAEIQAKRSARELVKLVQKANPEFTVAQAVDWLLTNETSLQLSEDMKAASPKIYKKRKKN